jgi:Predicted membrane protein
MVEMEENNLARRYLVFTFGIILNATGIAVTTGAELGTTPISSLPYVLSLAFPLSFGMFTFVLNILMVLAQAVLLRREFRNIQYLQIAAAVVFSAIIDMVMLVMRMIPVTGYAERFGLLLLGSAMLGVGICLEVYCNVMYIPGEGLVKAISHRADREFGVIKIVFDVTLVSSALIASLFFMNGIAGLREGTLFSALTVGLMARFFIKNLRVIERWINAVPQEDDPLP